MTEPEGRARDRFSLIGHAALPFMCPLREDELASLLEHAALAAGARTLDLGGGRADLAALLARRFGARAESVDRSAQAIEAARARTGGLDVTLVEADAGTHLATLPARSRALASCVGAVHCFGVGAQGWRATVRALDRVAERLLVGDLVATTARAAEAFEVAELDALATLASETGRTVRASLVLEAARVASYERAWCDAVAAHVAAHPDDPRNAWARARLAWTDAPALREARDALGFAVYLL